MTEKLNSETDVIEKVFTDKDGKVDKVLMKDGNSIFYKDFVDLFKMYLRVFVAGEVVSWDDVWRFSRLTDAMGMEEYLDNVEQEGVLKGSQFSLTRSQKMSLGALIIILMIIMLSFLIFASVLQSGG